MSSKLTEEDRERMWAAEKSLKHLDKADTLQNLAWLAEMATPEGRARIQANLEHLLAGNFGKGEMLLALDRVRLDQHKYDQLLAGNQQQIPTPELMRVEIMIEHVGAFGYSVRPIDTGRCLLRLDAASRHRLAMLVWETLRDERKRRLEAGISLVGY